jgi:WD40 repeat protein
MLADLKDRLRQRLGENVYEFQTSWTGRGINGDHIGHLPEHLDECLPLLEPGYRPRDLCEGVWCSLGRSIMTELKQARADITPLEREIAAHLAFGRGRFHSGSQPDPGFFTGRKEIFADIDLYLHQPARHPLVIWGVSGSGKSTLMAYLVEHAQRRYPHAEVVYRFIAATPESIGGRGLIEGLCWQIYSAYAWEVTNLPVEDNKLLDAFYDCLSLAKEDHPLILMIDALDQIAAHVPGRYLTWLPAVLPEHVHLLVSTTPGGILDRLMDKLGQENLLELLPMPIAEGAELLERWLTAAGRTLQREQRQDILDHFAQNGLPLYLELAFEEARRWHSYDGLTYGADGQAGLAPDVPKIVRDLFWRLSQEVNHGRVLVAHSLAYLVAARNGLTEDELIDLLSRDQAVMDDFRRRSPKSPPVERLPGVIWSRLYFDIEPYTIERQADGTTTYAFLHSQFGEVIQEDYLAEASKPKTHQHIAAYFALQALEFERGGQIFFNLRKLSELPYQQAVGELWAELTRTLSDFTFIQAKVTAVGPQALIEDYESAQDPTGHSAPSPDQHRTLATIQQTLRQAAHLLMVDPRQLASQLWGHLAGNETGGIQALLESVRTQPKQAWLRPVIASLAEPETLLRVFSGHDSAINAIAITTDGRFIVSASSDRTLKVWDMGNGKEVLTLSGHTEPVMDVKVTPSGRLAVSASDDHTIKIWNLETGALLHTLHGHTDRVTSVGIRYEKQIISASRDITLKIWDLEDGEELQTLLGHTDFVNAVAVSPDGQFAASASRDKTIIIWNLDTGHPVHMLTGHADWVNGVVFSPVDQSLVSASLDTTLKVWNLKDGTELRTLDGHSYSVDGLAITTDGRWLISASADETMKVWDLESGGELGSLTGHLEGVTSVALTSTPKPLSGESKLLAVSASYDRTIRVWDVRARVNRQGISKHGGYVLDIAVDGETQRAVTASGDSSLKIWDLERGLDLKTLSGHTGFVNFVKVLHDPFSKNSISSRRILSTADDGTVKVWNLVSGEEIYTYTGHSDAITALVVMEDGRLAVSAAQDGSIKAWDLVNFRLYCSFSGHQKPVNSLAVTHDRHLISVSSDQSLKIWDLNSGAELFTLFGHKDKVIAVAAIPYSELVVSASRDTTLKIWDLRTGKEQLTLFGHSNYVVSVAVTPAGDKLISASADGSIKVWNLLDGTELFDLVGHSGRVSSIMIFDGGRRAASVSNDMTLRVWDLGNGTCMNTFYADGILYACSVSNDGRTLVVGGESGRVHFLRLEGID